MGAFVYMLRYADQSFYVGSATGDDLAKRIAGHETGAIVGYTWARRPFNLFGPSTSNASLTRSRRRAAA